MTLILDRLRTFLYKERDQVEASWPGAQGATALPNFSKSSVGYFKLLVMITVLKFIGKSFNLAPLHSTGATLSLLSSMRPTYTWYYSTFSRKGLNREGGLIKFLVQKGGFIGERGTQPLPFI